MHEPTAAHCAVCEALEFSELLGWRVCERCGADICPDCREAMREVACPTCGGALKHHPGSPDAGPGCGGALLLLALLFGVPAAVTHRRSPQTVPAASPHSLPASAPNPVSGIGGPAAEAPGVLAPEPVPGAGGGADKKPGVIAPAHASKSWEGAPVPGRGFAFPGEFGMLVGHHACVRGTDATWRLCNWSTTTTAR